MSPLLPDPGPLPLPGPVWLFQLLLHVTFTFHLLAMNLLLGGGVAAALSGWKGKGVVPHHRKLAEQLFRLLPVANAATITLGVAPLLFVQVLYGRFFFTSSILMAVPWFLAVVLIAAAYFGFYRMAFAETVQRERTLWVGWTATLLVLLVAFLYTNNLTLMLTPERFASLYHGDPIGLRLNLSEPTLLPRFLHTAVAALAVTGLGIMALGHRARAREEEAFAAWSIRYGRHWFAGATLLQLVVGFWFLFALPDPVWRALLGGNAVYTGHLLGGVFLALLAVLFLFVKPDSRRAFVAACLLTASCVFAMVLVRAWVRDLMIGDLAGLESAAVRSQGSPMWIFLALLAAGIGMVAWMVRSFLWPDAEAGDDLQ